MKDLESPQKHLHAKGLDCVAIHKLVAKFGKETVTLAGKTGGANAKKAAALGEALVHASDVRHAAETKAAE